MEEIGVNYQNNMWPKRYTAKNGKFKFTVWFRENCPKLYEEMNCKDMTFDELLAIAKTTYYIRQKNGQLYDDEE